MPLLWLSTAFLCGVLSGRLLEGGAPVWAPGTLVFLSLLLLILSWLAKPRSNPTPLQHFLTSRWPKNSEVLLPGYILPCLPLAILGGMLRYQSTLPVIDPGALAWYNDRGERVRLEGELVADPEFRDGYTLLELEVDRLRQESGSAFEVVQGRLLARLPPGGDWRYGDRVLLEGFLSTPFESEGFSYRQYLAQRGIYTTLSCTVRRTQGCAWLVGRGGGSALLRQVYSLRRRASSVIYQLFPDPEAGLLAGILLGIETGIPAEVMDAFRLTGTAHVIAISGFNFAIIAGLFVLVFERLLGRWRSLPAAWLGIAAYAILAGASAGVVRAAVMGSLSIFALRLGRRSSGLNTLAFVACLMALFDPRVLWDVSFQLSFMATLGLMLYAEPLMRGFTSFFGRWASPATVRGLSGPLSEYLLFTLAAQVTTLPLILYYFQQVSLVSLLANPFVLPAQSPLMVLGGLSTLVGLLSRPLGQALAALAWPFVAFTIRLVEWFATLPGASVGVAGLSAWLVIGMYAVLFAATLGGGRLYVFAERRFKGRVQFLGWGLNLGLALLTLVVWQRVFALPDGRLHLTVLDTGGGEALWIRTPAGRSLLVNGGPSPNALSDAIGRRLPFGMRQIDTLVVACPDEEYAAALPGALDRFQVRNVLWAGPENAGYSARELQKLLRRQQIPVIQAEQGQVLELGEGARLELLRVTRRGALLLLEWENFRALLPVGLDADSLEDLLTDRRQRAVQALLLAGGGHISLNPPAWIERWGPGLALLSVAPGDEEGLPHPETLAALDGIPLLRTDWNGWIELSTDGEQMWIEVERK